MKKDLLAIISLGIIAVLSGGMWLFEVLLKGWQGLLWLEYFHKSIPFITLIFLVWVLAVSQVKPFSRKILLFCVLAGLSAVWTLCTTYIFSFAFVMGPEAFALLASYGEGVFRILQYLILPWFIIGAFIYIFILERFDIIIPFWKKTVSAGFYILCLPLGLLVLFILSLLGLISPNWVDFIHVVKTGAAIPFVVFGLGFPLIGEVKKDTQKDAE